MKKISLILLLLILALPGAAFGHGESGEAVTRLQTALYALGYLDSAPDGHYGKETARATKRLLRHAPDLREEEIHEAWRTGGLNPVSGELNLGDASEAVLLTQRRLCALGYLAVVDGRFGEETRRALQLFQGDNGLNTSGTTDPETRAALFAEHAAPAKYPVLARGMKGERVQQLQQRLRLLGFMTGDPDGDYGEETAKAVKALERYTGAPHCTGHADQGLQVLLYGELPLPEAADGQDTYRIQRRLTVLGYLQADPDGGYGEVTKAALGAFAKNAKVNGEAAAIERLFREDAPEAERPYRLVIDLSDQVLYVMRKKGDAEKQAYAMACSTGPEVAPGRYRELTRPGEEWRRMEGLGWVCCPYRLEPGLYLHSVPFDEEGGRADTAALSGLGNPSSAKGIMLSPENARFIWERCIPGTPVEIRE